MSILITGGAGFIGSHLAKALHTLGREVVLMDNFDDYYDPHIKFKRVAALPELTLERVDIGDREAVLEVFKKYRFTHVVNLAALPGVRYSVGRFRLYNDVNTMGAVYLMEGAVEHDVELFIQASTSSVYGQTPHIPFKESDVADRPLAPYPASKRAAELYGHTFHNLYGLNVTVLRFFNVYGPQGRPDMMPLRALSMMLQQEPIEMWNNGELQRDWTYIDDTVDGIISALGKPMGYQIINLGSGRPIAFKDFISTYEEITGYESIKVDKPSPKTEPLVTYCDNTLARRLLGFDPNTTLKSGLAQTWNWYQSEGHRG